jgi:hypothetical protein
MSIQQLQTEAAKLSEHERRALISYLVSLGRQRDPVYWDRLAEKIADNNPEHWVTAKQLDGTLGLE